jgi:hypothetical protein
MNKAQKHHAIEADGDAARPVSGIAYALTQVTVGDRTFSRGQPIGIAADLVRSCRNWRAMVANQIVEIRPA